MEFKLHQNGQYVKVKILVRKMKLLLNNKPKQRLMLYIVNVKR
jgi:hypothetical protein